jgi:adenosylcobinamide-GDP ribazoletransferase
MDGVKKLISAIQFMTILPLGQKPVHRPEGMAVYFPVVGLVVGALLCLLDYLVLMVGSASIAAVFDVVFLVLITGALHLDGLGDTFDGLYGQKSRFQALAIMKDSRLGTMGVVAIVCVLLTKWVGIAQLTDNRCLFLVLIPAYARSGLLFGIRFFQYGRDEEGIGFGLFAKSMSMMSFWGLMLIIALSLAAGLLAAILINLVFGAIVLMILLYYRSKLGAITGDMLGAMVEMTEAGLFLTVSLQLLK